MVTAEVGLVVGHFTDLARDPGLSSILTFHLKLVLVKSILYDVKVNFNQDPQKGIRRHRKH